MHKQRGAIGLVLILAVVALAVGGYFLYQKYSFPYSMGLIPTPKEEAKNTPRIILENKKETTEWVLSIDENLKFSVKHPLNWIFKPSVSETATAQIYSTNTDYEKVAQEKNEKVDYVTRAEDEIKIEVVKMKDELEDDFGRGIISEDKIILGEVLARRVFFRTRFGKEAILYVVNRGDMHYYISVGTIGEMDISQSKHLETQNEVLATLRFLD